MRPILGRCSTAEVGVVFLLLLLLLLLEVEEEGAAADSAPATVELTAVMKTRGGEADLLPVAVLRIPTAELMEAVPSGIIDIDEDEGAFLVTVDVPLLLGTSVSDDVVAVVRILLAWRTTELMLML